MLNNLVKFLIFNKLGDTRVTKAKRIAEALEVYNDRFCVFVVTQRSGRNELNIKSFHPCVHHYIEKLNLPELNEGEFYLIFDSYNDYTAQSSAN